MPRRRSSRQMCYLFHGRKMDLFDIEHELERLLFSGPSDVVEQFAVHDWLFCPPGDECGVGVLG